MQVEADQVANRVVVLGAIEATDGRLASASRSSRGRARIEPGVDDLELLGARARLSLRRHALRSQVVGHAEQQRPAFRVGSTVAEVVEDDAPSAVAPSWQCRQYWSNSGATSLAKTGGGSADGSAVDRPRSADIAATCGGARAYPASRSDAIAVAASAEPARHAAGRTLADIHVGHGPLGASHHQADATAAVSDRRETAPSSASAVPINTGRR